MSDVDTGAPAPDAEVPPSAPTTQPGTTDTPPTGTTPDPTPPAEPAATPSPDEKIVKKPWYQKKIAELSYQNRESQRTIERLLGIVESNRQTERRTGEEAPKPEQFNTLNDYIDAAVEYKLKNQRQEPKPEPRTPQSNPEFEAAREDLISEGLEKYEDFEEVINEGRYITPIMANAIVESDNRVELARFLCTNHKEAQRIAKLSPVRQAAEIGRIEDKLSARPVSKKPSNAPAPVNPVSGSTTQDNGPSDSDDIKTWIRKRQKQVHSR